MQPLVAGKRLTCELTGEKTYDRQVGVCYLDDSTEIGAAIIAEGLARDCPRYSGGRYFELETKKNKTLPFPGYCRKR
jgi:endonuclease YncB( thermonuclease family)